MDSPGISSPAVARRVVVALLLGIVALLAGAGAHRLSGMLWPNALPAANHTGMLAAGLLLILLVSRGRISAYGFRLPADFSLPRLALLSCGVAAVAFVAMKLLPRGGTAGLAQRSLLSHALLSWVYASIAEEVLARGLVQGYLSPLAARGLFLGRLRLSLPVLSGAAFFSAMHFVLLAGGVSPVTVSVIVLSAFALGLVAGYYCEKTDSLMPAIIAHALANLTGTVLAAAWKALSV